MVKWEKEADYGRIKGGRHAVWWCVPHFAERLQQFDSSGYQWDIWGKIFRGGRDCVFKREPFPEQTRRKDWWEDYGYQLCNSGKREQKVPFRMSKQCGQQHACAFFWIWYPDSAGRGKNQRSCSDSDVSSFSGAISEMYCVYSESDENKDDYAGWECGVWYTCN